MWDPGIKLRLSGFGASAFAHQTASPHTEDMFYLVSPGVDFFPLNYEILQTEVPEGGKGNATGDSSLGKVLFFLIFYYVLDSK